MWRRACAVALLCTALALCACKRAEMSASPFVFTRYGRSSPAHHMAQRDRFHLVGRYGKRSGMDDSQLRRAHHALALALARPDRRDRDRPREIERDGAWRESYPPYVAALLLRSYNKRAPEVVDVSSGEN
ncbi:uncharacterized protein LOC120625200 [Pararge aegeria]|uniref:uncharacterized protein LOC120625200 n=1 Tax=Pararge aegeria TaxID=116150 RepID=UPI0019D01064|nr:uncharacterized protein LOC120625200 [Pararge aegeria]